MMSSVSGDGILLQVPSTEGQVSGDHVQPGTSLSSDGSVTVQGSPSTVLPPSSHTLTLSGVVHAACHFYRQVLALEPENNDPEVGETAISVANDFN